MGSLLIVKYLLVDECLLSRRWPALFYTRDFVWITTSFNPSNLTSTVTRYWTRHGSLPPPYYVFGLEEDISSLPTQDVESPLRHCGTTSSVLEQPELLSQESPMQTEHLTSTPRSISENSASSEMPQRTLTLPTFTEITRALETGRRSLNTSRRRAISPISGQFSVSPTPTLPRYSPLRVPPRLMRSTSHIASETPSPSGTWERSGEPSQRADLQPLWMSTMPLEFSCPSCSTSVSIQIASEVSVYRDPAESERRRGRSSTSRSRPY